MKGRRKRSEVGGKAVNIKRSQRECVSSAHSLSGRWRVFVKGVALLGVVVVCVGV